MPSNIILPAFWKACPKACWNTSKVVLSATTFTASLSSTLSSLASDADVFVLLTASPSPSTFEVSTASTFEVSTTSTFEASTTSPSSTSNLNY